MGIPMGSRKSERDVQVFLWNRRDLFLSLHAAPQSPSPRAKMSSSSADLKIGAIQAISRDAYFTAVEGMVADTDGVPDIAAANSKRNKFPDVRGEHGKKSLEVVVKNTSKESLQWGMSAGIYSGLTYGLREVRGTHDWKNSAVAGAITGAAVALTSDNASHEQIVQCAITGAALSTAANLLSGIF